MAAVGLGFWRVRHRPAFQLMAVSSLCLVLLALSVRGYTPWKAIFDFFPAAGAIRAVSRVAIHLLLPAAVGLAMATEALVISRRWILFSAVLVVVAAEQVSPRPADAWAPVVANEVLLQNKVEQAAAGASCRAFLYTPSPASCSADEPWIVRHSRAVNAHLDAMWASNRTDIPTLNGYSGTLPPRYPFWGLSYCGPEDDARIKAMIAGWCLSHGCRPSSVCWIR